MAFQTPVATAFRDPDEALELLFEELRFRGYAESARDSYWYHVQSLLTTVAPGTLEVQQTHSCMSTPSGAVKLVLRLYSPSWNLLRSEWFC